MSAKFSTSELKVNARNLALTLFPDVPIDHFHNTSTFVWFEVDSLSAWHLKKIIDFSKKKQVGIFIDSGMCDTKISINIYPL